MSIKNSTKSLLTQSLILDYLKGIVISLLLSLGFIIIFAFSLNWFDVSDSFIPLITLIIKGICVLIGSCVAVRGSEKGLIKGIVFGLIYIFCAFIIFSILSGVFSFDFSFILDLAFASLLGGIVGIIKVNKASKI